MIVNDKSECWSETDKGLAIVVPEGVETQCIGRSNEV